MATLRRICWRVFIGATFATVSVGFVALVGGCPGVPPSAGCTSDADCDDGDRCTADTCDGGTCVNAPVEDCAPVEVTASVDGDAVPGGDVTAMVAVDIQDGSTVQSYSWSQSNGVSVTIENPNSQTTDFVLPGTAAYKDELIHVLLEPPITEDQLPPNVPAPEGEFPGGLQDRWQVVGIDPFALEEAGLVTLRVTVTTTSGTYTDEVEVHAELPWKVALPIQNVPLGRPVLLHGKTQDAYNWALAAPGGSGAALTDASTQSPYFTPDVSGLYTVTVTDSTANPAQPVTLEIYAGTWQGAVTGQDANGDPLADNCTICHNDTVAPDTFTDWAQTGHAHIFSDNLDTSTHYGEGCFACHTVGFDPAVANGAIDDAPDYQDFLDGGLLNNPGDNWTTMLAEFPEAAQLANIQCENCHGPQDSDAHGMGQPRASLASNVCGTCHGEPLRHARYQQWQLSGHANYELAIEEGQNESCSRCHTVNGFLTWLPILLDDDPATDPTDSLPEEAITWTPDETHPQTCVTCHDPHNIGTSTGVDTDATVRISGDTPPLAAGFQVFGAGKGAICMTCHNSRRDLRNDSTFDATKADGDAARAPHGSAQTDVLMGQNAYLVNTGIRGSHSLVTDTCVECHMDKTPPPDLLAYNLGGTNHTFFASETICAECHEEIEADSVEDAFEASAGELLALVEDAILDLMSDLIAMGYRIGLSGDATITSTSQIADIEFGESHGRQAITVTFTNGSVFGPYRMNDVLVLDVPGVDIPELYDFADDRLIKAGWNWNLANNDGSHGIHNPPFVFEFIDAAADALNELAAE